MCSFGPELEQQFEIGSLERQLEQQSVELEFQYWVSLRLQCHLKSQKRTVELQGWSFPALCKINGTCVFGRPEKVRRSSVLQ